MKESFGAWLAKARSTVIGKVGIGLIIFTLVGFVCGLFTEDQNVFKDATTGILFGIAMLAIGHKKAKEEPSYGKQSQITARNLDSYIIVNPGIRLESGEKCYYKGEAKSYHEKNVVVGRKSTGSGTSFRVAKGVSIRTGGGGSENIRGQVGESYDGVLFITNRRIILNAMKFGFDLPLNKIDSVNVDAKNGFMFFSGGKSYIALTKDVEKIGEIMALIEVPDENSKTGGDMSYIEELKQLKELLDDGAITEEEYNSKKTELLNK